MTTSEELESVPGRAGRVWSWPLLGRAAPGGQVWGALIFIGAVVLVAGFGSQFVLYEASLIAIYGVVTAGQELLIGRAGLISLGAAAIMAVGSFTTAILSGHGVLGTFPVPLVISAVFGAVVGVIVGVPGLRFRGLYLMLTTLALQYVITFATQEYQDDSPGHLGSGFTVIAPHWGSVQLSTAHMFFVICAVILGLTLWMLQGMFNRLPGRAWNALRQSEAGAASLGVNLVRWKLAAFVISSAITAVGGALYAYQVGQVEYSSYSINLGLVLIIMIFIGGIRTLVGPLLGAAALVLLPIVLQQIANEVPSTSSFGQWLGSNEAELAYAIYGLLLLIILIVERDGLWGLVLRITRLAVRGAELLQDRIGTRQPKPAAAAGPASAANIAAAAKPASPGAGATVAATTQTPATVSTRSHGTALQPVDGVHRPDGGGVLSVRDLRVRYPNGAVALSGVSLQVGAGEIVAVLGRNGAGKTTLLRAIGGFLRSEHVSVEGNVMLAGTEVCGRTPERTFGLGAVLVPEREKVFSKLTVEEHLRLVSPAVPAKNELVFQPLAALWDSRAGLLSGGERQMLAMEMAWCSSPRLLLADEISLGLAPVMVRAVLDRVVTTVKDRGVAAVIVEQDAAAALRVADRIYVIDRGSIIWSGPASETSAAEIAGAYLAGTYDHT
jgi:branched-chain amino acid transport system permease protein